MVRNSSPARNPGAKSLGLRIACPPYMAWERLGGEMPPTFTAAPAVGLNVQGSAGFYRRLHHLVPRLVRQIPWAPVVVVFTDAAEDPSEIAFAAAAAGARAVAHAAEAPSAALRRGLALRAELGFELHRWLRLVRPRAGPAALWLVEQLVAAGPRHNSAGVSLEEIGWSRKTAHGTLRRAGLPNATTWHQFGRAMPVLLRAQLEPSETLLRMAFEARYAKYSTFGRHVARLFGSSPKQVRRTLDWKWCAWAMLQRWEPKH